MQRRDCWLRTVWLPIRNIVNRRTRLIISAATKWIYEIILQNRANERTIGRRLRESRLRNKSSQKYARTNRMAGCYTYTVLKAIVKCAMPWHCSVHTRICTFRKSNSTKLMVVDSTTRRAAPPCILIDIYYRRCTSIIVYECGRRVARA